MCSVLFYRELYSFIMETNIMTVYSTSLNNTKDTANSLFHKPHIPLITPSKAHNYKLISYKPYASHTKAISGTKTTVPSPHKSHITNIKKLYTFLKRNRGSSLNQCNRGNSRSVTELDAKFKRNQVYQFMYTHV